MGKGSEYLDVIKSQGTDLNFIAMGSFPGVKHQNVHAANGAVNNMNVNGSVTPQEFSYAPAATDLCFVYSSPLVLVDDTTDMLPENFGGIPVLAQGLQLIVEIEGTPYEVCNITNNKDLTTCFFEGQLGSGKGTTGFLNTEDFITGRYFFDTPIMLDGSKGDRIFFKVRDDLTLIDHLEASFKISTVLL